jgi:putative ABC transport system substrate-binding protein
MMDRRTFLAANLVVFAAPLAAEAQPARTVSRVGFLRVGSIPPAFIDGFRQGLRELGYVEGQNITIEYGLAQTAAQLPAVASRLVRLEVDVLLASGVPSVLPAKNATKTIPVVFVAAMDPVATGVVASLPRPGANVTGLTVMSADLTGKRIQLLKELLPKMSRIALLVRPSSPEASHYVREADRAAKTLGASLQVLSAVDFAELEAAFPAFRGASVLIWSDDAVFTAHRTEIAQLAVKNRIPTICGLQEVVRAGALMGYGADTRQLYRLAATYVDKILKGARPADLPIEQPSTFKFAINLRTAKALGLTIPPSLLQRADEVIQ